MWRRMRWVMPVWAGPVSELVADQWALVSSHITLALLLFPACTALPGLWAVPLRVNGAACVQRTALPFMGITDEFKSCSSLGKITFTFFSLSFVCSFTPEPEPLTWGVAPADGRTVLPTLVPASGCCSHTHLWSKTPLMNWSLPVDTQVPSFPATKTKEICRSNYCQCPIFAI